MRAPAIVALALCVGLACAGSATSIAPSSPPAAASSAPSAVPSASSAAVSAATPSDSGPTASAWLAASTELPAHLKIPDAVLRHAMDDDAQFAVVEIESIKPGPPGYKLASWSMLGPIRGPVGAGGVHDARIDASETRLVEKRVMVLVFRPGKGDGAGVVYGIEEIPRARVGEYVTAYSVRCSQLQ